MPKQRAALKKTAADSDRRTQKAAEAPAEPADQSAEMLSGGEIIMRCLQEEGVDLIFGYPGGAVLHIYDALFQQQAIDHILVRHEQGAVHAADGYARATGKPGVALVTSGPGATNAITGLATAYTDSIPVVVISGQVRSNLIGTDAFQETDMIGLSRPIVKHSFLITDSAQLSLAFKKAFHIATTGRPGPVVLDIAKNATDPNLKTAFSYPKQIRMRSYTPPSSAHPLQIKRAAEAIAQATRPVIYSGGGVVQGNACKQLRSLSKLMGAPVTSTLMGLGAFPASDPNFLGMLGMHGTYEANMAMHHSDLIIAVGARFDDRVTNTPSKFCPDARIIHIDVDTASVGKIIQPDIPIVGPAEIVLDALIRELRKDPPDPDRIAPWRQQTQNWRNLHGLNHNLCDHLDPDKPIPPQAVVQKLWQLTQGKAYVTSDVGQHQMFAAQYYQFEEPRRWINSGGLGTMGFGLPAAMGVQLAFPKAQVVCLTGDGSIQMNIQELSTCRQYNLPIKIINLNNQALGMVRQWQDMQYGGRHSASTYQNSLPDFVALTESFGHVGMRVTRPEELAGTLEKCLKLKDKLVFLDVLVDTDEHVYPMHVAPDGSLKDLWLSKTERT